MTIKPLLHLLVLMRTVVIENQVDITVVDIATVMAFFTGVLPPTINYESPN